MTPSALQLERMFFTRVAIVASQDPAAKPSPQFETSVAAGSNPANRRQYQITITIKLLANPTTPTAYVGDVEATGFFAVSEAVPIEKCERFAAIHGSTLVYGMIRELISNLTARGPWPMFVLPTTSFADLATPETEQAK